MYRNKFLAWVLFLVCCIGTAFVDLWSQAEAETQAQAAARNLVLPPVSPYSIGDLLSRAPH